MADGDYISNRDDIEKLFGKENVKRWANPDNDGDHETVVNRIDWANEYAEQEFLGRIAEGPYDIIAIRDTPPKMTIIICASIAGSSLYDTRRVVDSEEATDRVSIQRKNAARWISQILSGRLKLIHPTTYALIDKLAQNSPQVYEE